MNHQPLATAIPVAVLCSLLLAGGCATGPDPDRARYGVGAPPRLFPDMGSHRRPVTTESQRAQEYFDQGLTWYYAFNHDEAVRSFGRAAELDPDCAMAWWGVALAQGPNYNDPVMTSGRSEAAWEALRNARARVDDEGPVERALIEALSKRYAEPWPEDRTELDEAYATAMAEVHRRFPDDSDVGCLYAESMMILRPWDLYDADREPREGTPRIVAVLERVMAADPDHPGANHLYIHAVEPANPDLGIAAADRLCGSVPSAGHLEHMPSHIYVQVGEWEKAIVQNAKAMAADDEYRRLSPEQFIQHSYMVHNNHMLVFAALMSGREREALEAARDMWADIPADVLGDVAPLVDPWMGVVYDVHKRFGRWDAILAEPAPPECMPITTATWRSARAVAYAAKKDFDGARSEHEAFRRAKAAIPEDHEWGDDLAHTVLQVADDFIAAEIALQAGDLETAARLLEKAAEVEDSLTYGEPPEWLQPVRHTLGAVYLKSGRYTDAERVYRADLAQWRDNGWSLYGLSRALRAQGRTAEAQEVMARFEQVWRHADGPTETSCMCIPKT